MLKNKSKFYLTTYDVLCEFAQILPDLYKQTCKDPICSSGTTDRITQYGITVQKQYGTASQRGWKYNVQLLGAFWMAIDYNFKDVHEPIISREDFERVQEKRGKTRKRKTHTDETNMFSGLLTCADCGSNMNYHFNQRNPDIKYFNCSSNN